MVNPPPFLERVADATAQFSASWKQWLSSIFSILLRVQWYSVIQRETPNASGFSVSVNSDTGVLIIDPAGAYATGTVVLPTNPTNQQRLEIVATKSVTAATFSTSKTISNVPTTLTAGISVALIYYDANSTWYRLY